MKINIALIAILVLCLVTGINSLVCAEPGASPYLLDNRPVVDLKNPEAQNECSALPDIVEVRKGVERYLSDVPGLQGYNWSKVKEEVYKSNQFLTRI